ncbi:MAG: ParB N-terminal domain-containing protein [Alkalispirochaeta sp.]
MARIETIDIQQVRVHHRVRRDLGDLQALMTSLRAHGLLNPIIVTENYDLVAGHRRLEAAKRLGWRAIQCRVVESKDKTQLLQMEMDENMARKDFSSDETADALVRLDRLKNPSLWRRIGYALAAAWRRITRPFRRDNQER